MKKVQPEDGHRYPPAGLAACVHYGTPGLCSFYRLAFLSAAGGEQEMEQFVLQDCPVRCYNLAFLPRDAKSTS